MLGIVGTYTNSPSSEKILIKGCKIITGFAKYRINCDIILVLGQCFDLLPLKDLNRHSGL